MDKTLLTEFVSWFSQFKKEHKKDWCAEKCDVIFFASCKNFERLLKKTERNDRIHVIRSFGTQSYQSSLP